MTAEGVPSTPRDGVEHLAPPVASDSSIMRTFYVNPVAFVMLDPDTRRRHLYVVGHTSAGKSTLLLNLIAQDLAAGQGLAVLDPHGDLAETVLLHLPRNGAT